MPAADRATIPIPTIRHERGWRIVCHRPDLTAPLYPTSEPAASVPSPSALTPSPLAPLPPPEHPSLATKAARLRRELTAWALAGAKLAPRSVRREREAICRACSYWSPTGNLGLGECTYPGCGCTRAKAALATSRCPHNPPKWPAYPPAER